MSYYYEIPAKDRLADWIMLLNEVRWMGLDDAVRTHSELHRTFGDDPSEVLFDAEREVSQYLRSMGLEHRYQDALSEQAGTKVDSPTPPSLEEVMMYLGDIPIHSGVVTLMQGVDDRSQVYIDVAEGAMPAKLRKAVIKACNRLMPPGIELKARPKVAREEFARQAAALDLVLRQRMSRIEVVPWKEMVDAAPATVTKSADGTKKIGIDVKVFKHDGGTEAEAERFFMGPVLVPEEEDTQGEIYSHEEVRKACNWWAENSGTMSLRHVLQGGRELGDDEIAMVQNFVMPCDYEYNGAVIKAGTWMLGAVAKSDDLWQEVVSGRLQTWSIGAEAWSWIEEVIAN